MVARLRDLEDRLASAPDLDGIRAVAARVEAELRTEGEAWIDVMRFQDVEPPLDVGLPSRGAGEARHSNLARTKLANLATHESIALGNVRRAGSTVPIPASRTSRRKSST